MGRKKGSRSAQRKCFQYGSAGSGKEGHRLRDFYDSSKGVVIIFVIFLIFADYGKRPKYELVTNGVKN
jgi:hypothetical protein